MTHALQHTSLLTLPPSTRTCDILQAFQKSQDPNKMNLGVGAYRDDQVR